MAYNILINDSLPDRITSYFDKNWVIHNWRQLESGNPICQDIEGFLVYGHPIVDGKVMDELPGLKVISNFGVGVDHIDLDAAKVRGISVGNTPYLLDGAAADMTFALLLAIARNLVKSDRYAHGPAFVRHDPSILHGQEVHGATLGIIGLGNIGYQLARRASGFDMRVIYHNRGRNLRAEENLTAKYEPLEELLGKADFVALTVPLTPETKGIIGLAELGLMKPSAFLINIARGPVVDHNALTDALERRLIAGAALDVTEPEPLPRNHPLLAMDNVIVTSHIGSATVQTREAMARRWIDNLVAGLSGQDLPSRIA
jgi:glyoxylate reductase